MSRTYKSGKPEEKRESIWEAMGLSKPEWEALHEFVHELIASKKPISECLTMIKEEFTSEEEVTLATYMFGRETKSPVEMIMDGILG